MPVMFNKYQSDEIGKFVSAYNSETVYMLREEDEQKFFVSSVDNDGEEFLFEMTKCDAVDWVNTPISGKLISEAGLKFIKN